MAFITSITSVTAAAGKAIFRFALNLSFICTPCVLVAAMVVSEINDRLSPNIAPPTTVPTHSGKLKSPVFATDTAIGTSTVIVPTDVPIDMEIRHATRNIPGMANLPGIIFNNKLAVLSTAPASLAIPLKAPAIRNINIIIVMLSSPIP